MHNVPKYFKFKFMAKQPFMDHKLSDEAAKQYGEP